MPEPRCVACDLTTGQMQHRGGAGRMVRLAKMDFEGDTRIEKIGVSIHLICIPEYLDAHPDIALTTTGEQN